MVLGWGQATVPTQEVGFLSGQLPVAAGPPPDCIVPATCIGASGVAGAGSAGMVASLLLDPLPDFF